MSRRRSLFYGPRVRDTLRQASPLSNFDIELSGDSRGYRVMGCSRAGNTGWVDVSFPFSDVEVRRYMQEVQLSLLRSASVVRRLPTAGEIHIQEFGSGLFDAIFQLPVWELFAETRHQASPDDKSLVLRLSIEPPELATLPWELLYDTRRDEYLSLTMPVVRRILTADSRRPLEVDEPLRILGMVAAPGRLAALDGGHERSQLERALAGLRQDQKVDLAWANGQTWWDMQRALENDDYHILHFVGHGGFDERGGEGVLALEAEDGSVYQLVASDLAMLLSEQSSSLRLVLLNSCESARSTAEDNFSSTASVLIRHGIPAVVAMQFEISDSAAITFCRGFYTAIAVGRSIEEAVTRGRRAIKLTNRGSFEWTTPVAYCRAEAGPLFVFPKRRDQLLQNIHMHDRPAGTSLQDSRSRLDIPGATRRRIDHASSVTSVAFHPRGVHLVSASKDGTALVCDATDGTHIARVELDGPVIATQFEPDGSRLVAVSKSTAASWETTGYRKLQWFEGVFRIPTISHDCRLVAAAEDEAVEVWDVSTGKIAQVLLRNVRGSISAIAFSAGGDYLAAGDKSGLTIWHGLAERTMVRLRHGAGAQIVAFSPDGMKFVTTSSFSKSVSIWTLSERVERAQLPHSGVVRFVEFSRNGLWLVTSSTDGSVRLWDVARGSQVGSVMEHDAEIAAISMSPDSGRVAVGCNDGVVRVWELGGGREIVSNVHDGPIRAVAFSPNGRILATGSDDCTARLWAL